MSQRKVVIIGAGPAGLTAAYELLEHSDFSPVIFEGDSVIGGICRTVNYKGNRMDIGGHRFYSKSDRVIAWWEQFLPIQKIDDETVKVTYQNKSRKINANKLAPDPDKKDRVMLIRDRVSRIFSGKKFYKYPIVFSFEILWNLGLFKSAKILTSYVKSHCFPIKPEVSLKHFFINRFGRELYYTFFKSYTEKVWGVPCSRIKAEWGAQRIKGLSLAKAVRELLRFKASKDTSIHQKKVETSLIEKFMYPKYGPGQMWEEVARAITDQGVKIHTNHKVVGIHIQGKKVAAVSVQNSLSGRIERVEVDYLLSTMPVKELITAMGEAPPQHVRHVAQGLQYRDFITVGVLCRRFRLKDHGKKNSDRHYPKDTWIYIQDNDMKMGRLQIFNNWSPYLVSDPNTVWVGTEYFCNEGDVLWQLSDEDMKAFAIDELVQMNMLKSEDVIDSTLIRMKKTYPAYFGSYEKFPLIRDFTDSIENLFLIGRNGMHRYNNQDHSMLTAMTAVENILSGNKDKNNVWSVNTEQTYHEERDSNT